MMSVRMTQRRLLWIACTAFGLAAAIGGGVAWWLTLPDTPKIDPDDVAQVALGQAAYAVQCARCHGANLEGQPNWQERQANGRLAPPHDASGHTWHHPDTQLFSIIKHGLAPYAPPGYQSDMPAYDDTLSDEQIAAVLAYISSQWPADIRARHRQTNSQTAQP